MYTFSALRGVPRGGTEALDMKPHPAYRGTLAGRIARPIHLRASHRGADSYRRDAQSVLVYQEDQGPVRGRHGTPTGRIRNLLPLCAGSSPPQYAASRGAAPRGGRRAEASRPPRRPKRKGEGRRAGWAPPREEGDAGAAGAARGAEAGAGPPNRAAQGGVEKARRGARPRGGGPRACAFARPDAAAPDAAFEGGAPGGGEDAFHGPRHRQGGALRRSGPPVRVLHPHPAAVSPPRPRREGRDGPGADRHGEDGGVPRQRAHLPPAPPEGEPHPGLLPRARPRPHEGARHPDIQGRRGAREVLRHEQPRGLRGDGVPRAARRAREAHRHTCRDPGAHHRLHAERAYAPRGGGDPRHRRGGPDARHGVHPRRPPHRREAAARGRTADDALQRDPDARDHPVGGQGGSWTR